MKDKQLFDKIERFNRLLHDHNRRSRLYKRLNAAKPNTEELAQAEALLAEIKQELVQRRQDEEKKSANARH